MGENQVVVELEQVTNTCFVVMPFHSLFEAEYERVIRPAVEDAGLNCVRGDEIYTRQSIVHDIWQSIRQARVVVAELSGRNPNVMYEIGLAHAIGNPIVFLTRNEDDVPFDLRALRYVFYDPNNPFWGEDLRSELTRIVRRIVETPSLAAHLGGISVETVLPKTPEQPVMRGDTPAPERDFSGTWTTSWLSIQRERKHQATLVIPRNHGNSFTAPMTVAYLRDGDQTIVHETMTGTARGQELFLTGVNYTYVQQGNSRSYSLDSFELALADDSQSMSGKAVLAHGTRDVVFQKLPEASSNQ
jgi:hypothetical protein